jgi:hypothetical protein
MMAEFNIMRRASDLSEKLSSSERYKEEIIDRLRNLHPIVERAWQTAIFYHRGIDHRRKYINDEYENHLLETCLIASIVASKFEGFFSRRIYEDMTLLEVLYTVLLLHDVIEDTPCTMANLEAKFPEEIAFLVKNLTDADYRMRLNWKTLPLSKNRLVRLVCKVHKLDVTQTPPGVIGKRDMYLLLHFAKLCDMISNTASIVQYDYKFAEVYLVEKCLVLDRLFSFLIQHGRDLYEQIDTSIMQEIWEWISNFYEGGQVEDLKARCKALNDISRHALSSEPLLENLKKDFEVLQKSFSKGLKQVLTDENRRNDLCGF